jgi:hypothetical protein
MIIAILSNLPWLIGGIVLGVIFDEFFSKVFKRGRAKVKEVVEDIRNK